MTVKMLLAELQRERNDIKNMDVVIEYNGNEHLDVAGFHCDGKRFVLEVDAKERMAGPVGEDN